MAYSDRQFKESNVNYLNKDFNSFKTNLIEYAKTYFPNSYKDFNETSPGMMLLEMSAYVGDVLSFYIDQQYKEMMLPLAQERRNLINIAKMLGYKVKPTIPAYVDINVTQIVNSTDDVNDKKPNYSEAVIVDKGLQIQSSTDGDIFFETLEPVDFTLSSSIDVPPVEYELDGDGLVASYQLSRKVRAISGKTKTQDFTIASPQKYLRLTLTEKNVIEILNIEDLNNKNKWYEVDYLAQDKVAIEDFYTTTDRNTGYTDINGNQLNMAVPYTLQYIKTGKRFITEVNDDNTTSIVFGNGILRNGQIEESDFVNASNVGLVIPGDPDTSDLDISLDPRAGDSRMTLGETPSNTTLRVTYRVGGGLKSNVSSGTLTSATNSAGKYLSAVTTAFSVTNDEPAYGGSDQETIEEIRHKTKQFFATQNRCVTKEDYEARVLSMPPRLGSIAKVFADTSSLTSLASSTNALLNNMDLDGDATIAAADFTALKNAITNGDDLDPFLLKIENFFMDYANIASNVGSNQLATIDLHVLGYNNSKNLITFPIGDPEGTPTPHPVKQNIKQYLNNYRLITDQINIIDGKIINFGVAFEVVAHRSSNKQDVKMRCINKITEYFNIDKMQFRQPIYTTDLEYELMGLEGVRSVSWVELTQDFSAGLVQGQLPGIADNLPELFDKNNEYPDGDVNDGTYGWQYDFSVFYTPGLDGYVAKGVILPSVEPAVFELKKPKQNIRGVVL